MGVMNRQMAIYAFEGPNELYVHASFAAAEGYFEAIDIENGEYVFFGDDGTVVVASVRDSRVVLSPTEDRRIQELRDRLRVYLSQSSMTLDVAFADDSVGLAARLLARERAHRRSGGLARLLGRGTARLALAYRMFIRPVLRRPK
jgi:hypothetical protein